MIKSMTGYGRSESGWENKKLVVEIKSLNHRFLEVYVRLPNTFNLLELDIKKKIGDYISRGRLEVNVRLESEQGLCPEPELELNRPLIRRYYDLYSQIKQEFAFTENITLSMLTGIKDAVLPAEKGFDLAEIWPKLEKVLEEALESLTTMRQKEGETLYRDLISRSDQIAKEIDTVRARSPQVILDYQKRLADRVKELTSGIVIDETRLAQEVAMMAERSDITEEIVRFDSHMDQLKDMLRSEEPVGRKLDFLLQEMNREVNTIGSKSSDVAIARSVVDVKSELSKLREQIQNIE